MKELGSNQGYKEREEYNEEYGRFRMTRKELEIGRKKVRKSTRKV